MWLIDQLHVKLGFFPAFFSKANNARSDIGKCVQQTSLLLKTKVIKASQSYVLLFVWSEVQALSLWPSCVPERWLVLPLSFVPVFFSKANNARSDIGKCIQLTSSLLKTKVIKASQSYLLLFVWSEIGSFSLAILCTKTVACTPPLVQFPFQMQKSP